MAVNPNPVLSNRNTLYLADSGGGKSQALKQNREIPKAGARVVLFDTNEDHKASRFYEPGRFGRALVAGVRSGRGFRVAYCGSPFLRINGKNFDVHEWFCELVFSLLDGRKMTYIIDEEISGSVNSVNKAPPNYARLMNQCRKFGGVYHGTTQYPTEIPKTVYKGCHVKYVGMQAPETCGYVAKAAGVKAEDLGELVPLEFYVCDSGKVPGDRVRKLKLKYKK